MASMGTHYIEGWPYPFPIPGLRSLRPRGAYVPIGPAIYQPRVEDQEKSAGSTIRIYCCSRKCIFLLRSTLNTPQVCNILDVHKTGGRTTHPSLSAENYRKVYEEILAILIEVCWDSESFNLRRAALFQQGVKM